MRGDKPRTLAAEILARRVRGGEFIEDLLEHSLARASLAPRDRRLCQELVYGVVRWQATLDWLIDRKTGGRTQKPRLRELLRLGLYQILWLDRIPSHAAVNETVQLARESGFGAQAGFVNALLRGYAREREPARTLLSDLKASDPALGFSHPNWLVERWTARWGAEQTARLLDWNNQPPSTFARINTLKSKPEAVLSLWRDEEVEYASVRRDWLGDTPVFELKAHPPLERLKSFQKGFFYVQDPGTLLAPIELGAKPGEAILDLCAAPGGKLSYLAQIVRNEGRILGHDVAPERLKLIRENCARLGVTCVEVISPRELESLPESSFDRVLLDAPCSNTGVMRRRVDLRWRLRAEEIARLAVLQSQLLLLAARFLKPGGTLVYSTCSLELEENEQVVNAFLAEHKNFVLEFSRELTPFGDEVDGAFVARMRRENV